MAEAADLILDADNHCKTSRSYERVSDIFEVGEKPQGLVERVRDVARRLPMAMLRAHIRSREPRR
jgi:hypothetical protein